MAKHFKRNRLLPLIALSLALLFIGNYDFHLGWPSQKLRLLPRVSTKAHSMRVRFEESTPARSAGAAEKSQNSAAGAEKSLHFLVSEPPATSTLASSTASISVIVSDATSKATWLAQTRRPNELPSARTGDLLHQCVAVPDNERRSLLDFGSVGGPFPSPRCDAGSSPLCDAVRAIRYLSHANQGYTKVLVTIAVDGQQAMHRTTFPQCSRSL